MRLLYVIATWVAFAFLFPVLALMKKTQKKYELEALSSRGIRFITEEYIPHKLKNRLWLD